MRKERDLLGEMELESDYPFGIHTKRAIENFNFTSETMNTSLFQSVIMVKKACVRANLSADLLDKHIGDAIEKACDRALAEKIVPPLHPFQGGAGTSINMAANELLANYALAELSEDYGRYDIVSPLGHVNLSQSTNDLFLTACKHSFLVVLKELHRAVEALLDALQKQEQNFSHILKIGRTELQDAMPMSVGQEFGAWAEAVSRFRWRLSKASDWIREVNLGGTAIGTGVNADDDYREAVINELRIVTGEPLTRARNMVDATQNGDSIVEIAGLIKSGAVSIKKMASDWRLLSSGPLTGFGELILPPLQAGSSIMPGKVNPVLAEAAEQVAIEVMSADARIATAVSESNLELQQFMPFVAHTFLHSAHLFAGLIEKLSQFVPHISVNEERLKSFVASSYAVATLLAPTLGHDKIEGYITAAKEAGVPFANYIVQQGYITEERLKELMTPEVMASPGLPL
ncbi:aspartate ammonia-lyase [bacterium]|nr:aspartate ammonia-lyase [bacterium]